MALAYPIVEQIAQEVVTRLEAITIANGYQVDVGTILRPRRLGNVGTLGYTPEDLMITVEQGACRKLLEVEGNGPFTERVQTFLLAGFRKSTSDGSTALDQLVNVFVADIEKAITLGHQAGYPYWEHFTVSGSNLALNAELMAPEFFSLIDNQVAGASVQLDVHYRTRTNNPYSTS